MCTHACVIAHACLIAHACQARTPLPQFRALVEATERLCMRAVVSMWVCACRACARPRVCARARVYMRVCMRRREAAAAALAVSSGCAASSTL
eukprot:3140742-Pleurochrysis_carterae.AAC.1